ncbi:MAG: lantibiotic leader peptide-processing serine protease [Actinomycetota bacterium]|nr:lantibiotic leader peptide-processing serine protease [Actinomycetota bacterium]
MRKFTSVVVVALLAAGLLTSGSQAKQAVSGKVRYTVLAKRGVSSQRARSSLESLGARIVRRPNKIGLATVVADAAFVRKAMDSGVFQGVARDRIVGRSPQDLSKGAGIAGPSLRRGRAKAANHLGEDSLWRYQWHMRQVNAGPSNSYELSTGDSRVLVGIMDTGIDARHIDVGDNFNKELSRNFTHDMPSIDGKCKKEPDHSCTDSAIVDEDGHGTWTSTTVAGARNGVGVSGVAPDVTLVNIRAGQDSGYFFLQPTVDALTYAGDIGIDVVNMSFFVDPWLYNCPDNPRDSPEAQLEQQTIIDAMQRALNYAHDHGVTLVSAAGNEWTDLGHPTVDEISPDFPVNAPYKREIDNSCISLPTEGDHVIAVAGTGPSGRKGWLSNYGTEQIDVAAPMGDSFDKALPFPYNMALSAWSTSGIRKYGLAKKNGKPVGPDILRRCSKDAKPKCSYYLFAEGTSIASPIAAGVAALIVSEFGVDDGAGGLTMDPDEVEAILESSARQHPCPDGGVQRYPEVGHKLEDFGITEEELTARCDEGEGGTNGFYGHGIVNAVRALESSG